MRFRFLLPALLLAAPLLAQTRVFRVDDNHTVLGFKASTLLFDVPGRFTRFKADIQGDPATLEGASIRLDIDARSINTANGKRDEHLRSDDFFDAAKYPKITFTSKEVRRDGDRVLVRGTLAMHGVTRDLELPFLAAEGMNGADVRTWSYRATLPLDRLDYGVGADSVAAKISLKRQVELDLLLVGFFEAPPAKAPAAKKAPASKK
ncbi:MAG: YceI family protein [Geothrix sp.]|uniref:YceI family protein n=1 Tax=Geothrix sp. TaxID=1962974 RepID=UPI00185B234D|nr:YceI family protein [Geothrix sp.]NWJ41404.1 YceI family protein [Geothrix sp.]WIL20609.1 MAG: YceI family protein [Geothrix sp.]